MKKILALLLSVMMMSTVVLAGCGSTGDTSGGSNANSGDVAADKTYNIGICQLVQHVALDAATQGFKDYLTEKLGDKVKFNEQNAQGDSATCTTIANQFVADGVDLILGNATPALQAAFTATDKIPVLGTSITDYGTALDIAEWKGSSGFNVSGTADLAPLDGQADIIKELFPDAKTIGLLYCSAEPNSKYQCDTIATYLTDYEIKSYTFSDSNDIAAVTTAACDECDVLYIPTDNAAASNTGIIDNIAAEKKIPIVCHPNGVWPHHSLLRVKSLRTHRKCFNLRNILKFVLYAWIDSRGFFFFFLSSLYIWLLPTGNERNQKRAVHLHLSKSVSMCLWH